MQPRKSILDKSFSYTPSHQTDIGKRFKAIERERKLAAHKPTADVVPMGRKRGVSK